MIFEFFVKIKLEQIKQSFLSQDYSITITYRSTYILVAMVSIIKLFFIAFGQNKLFLTSF